MKVNIDGYVSSLGLTPSQAKMLRKILGGMESEFSFDDLQAWGSNSGDTSICYNCPEKGDVSVYLKHKPTGKTGYVKLPNYSHPETREGELNELLPETKEVLGKWARKHSKADPLPASEQDERPKIVCLCGSTRFKDAFIEANKNETISGNIVLTVGMFGHIEGLDMNSEIKKNLDELHKRKIDLADEVFVLNVGGYIGESTTSEIVYAFKHHKTIKYLEPLRLNSEQNAQASVATEVDSSTSSNKHKDKDDEYWKIIR